ncbi:MAG TPA: putative aminohydrolase SsnA [Sediminispirochaeta sp.]|nr:putative aminohydrolase SsnA [Sediminispirochaeta sp.]
MIVIKNTTAVEFNPPSVRPGVDIVVDGGKILAVGPKAGEEYQGQKVIDGSGKIVFPGLVCSHHHYYSGLARGIMANVGPTPDFVSVLRNLWWKLDRGLDEETLYYSSIINSIEAIKSGTTAVIDHHASPNYIRGSLGTVKQSFVETGLRGMTCYEVTDRNGREGMLEGIEENRAFAEEAEREKRSGERHLVEAAIGGHAPFTIPDEGLKAIADLVESSGRGFHVHVAEGKYDVSYSHLHYNRDIMSRLDDFGLLNDKSLFVHGVHLSAEDVEKVNGADAFLIHNPKSNMNNGVGYNHRLPEYRNVAIGTDGIGANMFEEYKFAFFKHMDAHGSLGPDAYLQYLYNGNRILERYFGEQFGKLEAGYKADLVISDYQAPTPLEAENLAGHLAFGISSTDVRTVIIDGELVYEDREFPFDAREIFQQSQNAARKLWNNINKL